MQSIILILHVFTAYHQALGVSIPRTEVALKRMLNQDAVFGKWPTNEIPFYFDPLYNADELRLIRVAIGRVLANFERCLAFVEVSPAAQHFKLRITPTINDNGSLADYCNALPGLFLTGYYRGDLEQRLILARGPFGCLNGSIRKVMKYITLALGKRNEHQRKGRDQFIQLNHSNIIPEMLIPAYRPYEFNEAFTPGCRYDYCSITHNLQSDYALAPGTMAFTVLYPPFFIPELDVLSECDCQELTALYSCRLNKCQPMNCASLRPPPSVAPQEPLSSSPPPTDNLTTICYQVDPTSDGRQPSVMNMPATVDSLPPNNCYVEADLGTLRDAHPPPDERKAHSVRAMNVDSKYVKWPFQKIPYYLDKRYTPAEVKIVQDAIRRITENLKGCVQFVPVQSTSADYKLKITPFGADGKTEDKQCSSYPGIYHAFMLTRSEQLLVLARGTDGCLGGTRNNILKYLAIALGKRPEHQRPDRDKYIQIQPENIKPEMLFAYSTYNWTFANSDWPYDLCSVTHNQPESFAKPGKESFLVRQPPYRIPMLDRLSEVDCKEISSAYKCDPNQCDRLACEELVTTTTRQPTTTQVTSSLPTQTTSHSSPSLGFTTSQMTTKVTTSKSSQTTTTTIAHSPAMSTTLGTSSSVAASTSSQPISWSSTTKPTSVTTVHTTRTSSSSSSLVTTPQASLTSTSGVLSTSTLPTSSSSSALPQDSSTLAPSTWTLRDTVSSSTLASTQSAATEATSSHSPFSTTTQSSSSVTIPTVVTKSPDGLLTVCYQVPSSANTVISQGQLPSLSSSISLQGAVSGRMTCVASLS